MSLLPKLRRQSSVILASVFLHIIASSALKDFVLVILIEVLHRVPKSKRLSSHRREWHQTKSSGRLDLSRYPSLGLGTDPGL